MHTKQSNEFQFHNNNQDVLHMPPSSILLGKLSLE